MPLENYEIHVVTNDGLIKKSLPHVLITFYGNNINFHDNLSKLTRLEFDSGQQKMIIIDFPRDFNELQTYINKLEKLNLFFLVPNNSAKFSTVNDCLTAFQGVRKKIFSTFSETFLSKDKRATYSELHNAFPEVQENANGEESLVGCINKEELSKQLEYISKLNIRYHLISKPVTVSNVFTALEQTIPNFCEKIEKRVIEAREKSLNHHPYVPMG